MAVQPHCIFIVLDEESADQIAAKILAGPMWLIATPNNTTIAKRIWALPTIAGNLYGITVFKPTIGASTEETLLSQLDVIDLHQGVYSANPPYTVLAVTGVALTEKLQSAFAEYGFVEFQVTERGFRAIRSVPQPCQAVS